MPGDRVQLLESSWSRVPSLARFTIRSVFPLSLFVDASALGSCPRPPRSSLQRLRAARARLPALRKAVAKCDPLDAACMDLARERLLEGMRKVRELCAQDEVCSAKQKALRLLKQEQQQQ